MYGLVTSNIIRDVKNPNSEQMIFSKARLFGSISSEQCSGALVPTVYRTPQNAPRPGLSVLVQGLTGAVAWKKAERV